MPPVRRLSLDLPEDAARAILAAVDPAAEFAGTTRLHGGSTEVYRLDLAGGAPPLVVKLYPDEPEWAPAKERLVSGWLGAAPIPIPRWLRLDVTRTLLPVRFAVTTWLPGAPMRAYIGDPASAAAYRRMGGLLRRLHAIPMAAFGYIVDQGIHRPRPDNASHMAAAFEAAFRGFRQRGGDAGLAARLQAAVDARRELFAGCDTPVFCHDDFQPGNILAERDGGGALRLTGLIDFANAQAGDPLMDLAKAIFCCGHEDPSSLAPLREGYGPIDHPDPDGAIWLYLLYHRVTMWRWLAGLGQPDPELLRQLAEMVA